MFERLQKKWKVGGARLFLILCTFAIGGSLTGYAGRKLMPFLGIEQKWLWVIVYILIVSLLWPIAVLFVSVLFGQFKFFTGYLKKIGRRMGIGRKERVSSAESIFDFGYTGFVEAIDQFMTIEIEQTVKLYLNPMKRKLVAG